MMIREKSKAANLQGKSTDAWYRGRSVCSSDEVFVMKMEQRNWLMLKMKDQSEMKGIFLQQHKKSRMKREFHVRIRGSLRVGCKLSASLGNFSEKCSSKKCVIVPEKGDNVCLEYFLPKSGWEVKSLHPTLHLVGGGHFKATHNTACNFSWSFTNASIYYNIVFRFRYCLHTLTICHRGIHRGKLGWCVCPWSPCL